LSGNEIVYIEQIRQVFLNLFFSLNYTKFPKKIGAIFVPRICFEIDLKKSLILQIENQIYLYFPKRKEKVRIKKWRDNSMRSTWHTV